MANYYNSSLTGAQIEAILTGVRTVDGIVKSNGLGMFSAATSGVDFAYPMLTGIVDPTAVTSGAVNQLYLNTVDNRLFVCSAISGASYTWKAVGDDRFVVRGIYATLAELQAAQLHPAVGDAYAVGTASSNVIYIWNGSAWANIGTLKGDQGVSPQVTITTITGGHRVTITDEDHPSGQSFDVMDGEGAVSSVNTKTGAVVLYGSDINRTSGSSETISSALDELEGTWLTGTLSASATTVTFTDASIGSTSIIDVYTDTFGVNPTAMTISGTTLTLTFTAQSSAVSVKVQVR